TGLPRHDWMRTEEPISRAELVVRLRHLEASAGFGERFQYNSLTPTVAGHAAEIVTGQMWEDLIRARVFTPLEMNSSRFGLAPSTELTLSYHESQSRQLRQTRR